MRWLGYLARVVMGEDRRAGIVAQGGLDDFTRVNAGLSQCAFEKLLGGNNPILCVEKKSKKDFVLQGCNGRRCATSLDQRTKLPPAIL
jgi:hypothetical protein